MREPFVPTLANRSEHRLKFDDCFFRFSNGRNHLLMIAPLERIGPASSLEQHYLNGDRTLCLVVEASESHLRQVYISGYRK